MRNPLQQMRDRRGLTRAELAQVLAVSYNHLAACELGLPARLPASILRGLERLGEDADRLQEEYRRWRAARGQEVAAR